MKWRLLPQRICIWARERYWKRRAEEFWPDNPVAPIVDAAPTITPEDLYRHAATAYESESNLFQRLSLSRARMEQLLRLWPGVAANSARPRA